MSSHEYDHNHRQIEPRRRHTHTLANMPTMITTPTATAILPSVAHLPGGPATATRMMMNDDLVFGYLDTNSGDLRGLAPLSWATPAWTR